MYIKSKFMLLGGIFMGKSCYLGKSGKNEFEIPYSGYSFQEGMCLISALGAGAKYGYINKNGVIAIKVQYDRAQYFSEGLAAVAFGYKYGYIDKQGNTVIGMQFGEAGDFSEGLAAVRIDGKWGFIDKSGKMVIKPAFDAYIKSIDTFYQNRNCALPHFAVN